MTIWRVTMDKNERKILKSEINDRQILNIEEISLMFKYLFTMFFKKFSCKQL